MNTRHKAIASILDAEKAIASILDARGYDLTGVGCRDYSERQSIYWAQATNTWGVVVTVGCIHGAKDPTMWGKLVGSVEDYVRFSA